ncbi:MAG: NAD(P)/FAD-dependent oxidoreductase [Bacteroidetes bacterium]|nr:NAD(P)/FAD-dependent oxidoreductase [Bacteroidota bacterium]MCH8524609.1 NAD(P)/FAD-dependent oxidoreductase [Balneolales bacterium]
MEQQTILVLGGGIGGLRTARELSAKLGNEGDAIVAKILVFEKEQKSTFSPSLTWLMVGKRKEWQVERELNTTSGDGIEFIFGSIENVDPKNLTVTSGGKTYKGNHIVISLGAQQVIEQQLDAHGHNFYTVDGAGTFYESLKSFRGGHVVVMVSSLPYKSPVAPYEAAMLIDNYLREKGIREKAQISVVVPENEPMPFAGKEVSENILKLMEAREINYLPGYQFKATREKELVFTTAEGDKSLTADLLTFTPKHESPTVIQQAGLTGKSGWVEVNRDTLKTDFDHVYAIGDITTITLGESTQLPKAGVFAQHQAQVVAHNIVREIYGKSADKLFKAEGNYIMDLGDGKASKVGGDFYNNEVDIKEAGVMNQWMKQLQERSWFIKNF